MTTRSLREEQPALGSGLTALKYFERIREKRLSSLVSLAASSHTQMPGGTQSPRSFLIKPWPISFTQVCQERALGIQMAGDSE